MHLKSILNHVHPLKSFVYKRARLIKAAAGLPARIEVEQVPWATGKCQLTTSCRWFLAAWAKRLSWVAEERTEKSLRSFFESLSTEVKAGIQFVASDMWKPYLKVIAEQIPAALHVLDRFHIMRNMNVAIDEVRRAEATKMKQDGHEPILSNARWCLLKRPENLTENQEIKLKELLD